MKKGETRFWQLVDHKPNQVGTYEWKMKKGETRFWQLVDHKPNQVGTYEWKKRG